MSLLEWDDRCARLLIQYAARNAPPSLSERLAEEWLADLAARDGRMARLRFGFGCCWATRVIAHEHCIPKIPAAVSATGHKTMSAYAQHDSAFFSRRMIAFLLIVCLHAVLIYALATGLVHNMIAAIPQPMQIALMQEPATRNEPPPLPKPTLSPPRYDVPALDHVVDTQPDVDAIRDVVSRPPEPLMPPSTPPQVVKRVLGGPGAGFPSTEDYYPSAAIRAGEKGIASVRVCVDERGRLTAAPTLAQSSGSPRIDEGGLKLAKAASGHYRATTEDGRPVSSCYVYRIRFDLKD